MRSMHEGRQRTRITQRLHTRGYYSYSWALYITPKKYRGVGVGGEGRLLPEESYANHTWATCHGCRDGHGRSIAAAVTSLHVSRKKQERR